MTTLDVINGLEIASPCPASWNAMKGDDRTRFCATCEKHVYNLAALTTPEVVSLIERTEGRFCARIYRRRDGTVLTGDCPVGARAWAARRLQRALTLAVLGLGSIMALFLRPGVRGATPPIPPAPEGPGVTFSDWSDWALEAMRLRPPAPGPRVTAGEPLPMALGKIIVPPACNALPPAVEPVEAP
jgi:hypothetical protein